MASLLAIEANLQLVQHSETHFALKSPSEGWRLELYPSNQRIYANKQQRVRPPFLRVPSPWTLVDVIEAASTSIKGGE